MVTGHSGTGRLCVQWTGAGSEGMVLGGGGFNTRGRMMIESLCWLVGGVVVGVIAALILTYRSTKKVMGKVAGEFLQLVFGRRRP